MAFPAKDRHCPACNLMMPSTLVYTLPSAESNQPSEYPSYVFVECVSCGEYVGKVVGGDPMGPQGLITEPVTSRDLLAMVIATAKNAIPSAGS